MIEDSPRLQSLAVVVAASLLLGLVAVGELTPIGAGILGGLVLLVGIVVYLWERMVPDLADRDLGTQHPVLRYVLICQFFLLEVLFFLGVAGVTVADVPVAVAVYPAFGAMFVVHGIDLWLVQHYGQSGIGLLMFGLGISIADPSFGDIVQLFAYGAVLGGFALYVTGLPTAGAGAETEDTAVAGPEQADP